MGDLISSISSFFDGGATNQTFSGFMDLPSNLLILIAALCLFGTNVISNITARNNLLEYGVIFSSLFISAIAAIKFLSGIEFPVSSQLAQSIVTANIGMTCAGLLIMGLYGTKARLS